jgi:Carboxypeptidase regulatory-like domain
MRLASITFSLVFLFTLLCFSQTKEQTTPAGRISGIVLNEDGLAIQHAVVCISLAGSSKTECSVFTDASGQFEMPSIRTGSFLLFATKEEDGYSVYNQGQGQKVVLKLQEPKAYVTIRLPPKAGTLIGSVTDSLTGKPIDRISVRYIATDGTLTGNAGQYTGEFRINIPTTTEFSVVVSAPGYRSWAYSDPEDPSHLSLHLASGEKKSLNVELVPEPKTAN